MSVTHKYFNKDYWEKGDRSGYTIYNYNQGDYMNEAKAVYLAELYEIGGIWLEAGCAFGWVVEQLRLLDIHALGFDISKHAIKNGYDYQVLRQSDGLKTALYTKGQYSLIYSFETAEHVAEMDVEQWLSNLFLWLKPGGHLFLTICLGNNNIRGLDDNDKSHQTLQPRLWWEDWLDRIGFIKDEERFKQSHDIIIETEEMSIRGTPENIIEKYGLHVFTWRKPDGN